MYLNRCYAENPDLIEVRLTLTLDVFKLFLYNINFNQFYRLTLTLDVFKWFMV